MKTQGMETTELKDIMIGFLEQNREGMASLLEWFLNNVMEMEVEQQANASLYERCGRRKAYRNGYKPRTLNTVNGTLSLSKPQLRGQSFETQVFDRYSRVEKSLQLAVVESYLQGVSTRNVKNIIEKLGARIADAETELLWEGYFDELKARGLHGVKMVISDGHRGTRSAVER